MCNNFQQIVCGSALTKTSTHSRGRNHRSGTGNHSALFKPSRSKKPLLQLLAVVTLGCCGHVADAHTTLPDVPSDSSFCIISPDDEFRAPPDNLKFSPRNDCSFLERAERMFLWVTSPYGRDSYVFRSPAFFDAWSTDSGLRELKTTDFNLTNSKLKNLDVKIAFAPGEAAGGKVLATQDCRIVYYLIQVNDVYAYFLTGVKNRKIITTEFPTGKILQSGETDIDMTVNFAREHNKELEDRMALAVELKSAWVDVTESENMNYITNYITMKRPIPTYNNPVPCSSTSTSTSWSLKEPNEWRLLALVGMHVVFSAKGHPEMVWSTFEHVNNTPNNDYTYFKPNLQVATRLSDIAARWMFSDSDRNATFNKPRMHFEESTGNIVADDPKKPIGPSNIRRNAPWGSPGRNSDLNTKIISINDQFIGRLADNDIRKNYIMIGASWTSNGGDPRTALRRGSDRLVNTTMETFVSTPMGTHEPGSSTCLDCHKGPMLGDKDEHGHATRLSHIFGVLKPLPFDP